MKMSSSGLKSPKPKICLFSTTFDIWKLQMTPWLIDYIDDFRTMIWVRVRNSGLFKGMCRISFGIRRITWAVGALFTSDSLFPFIVSVLDRTVLLHEVTCRLQTGRQTQTARFHELHPHCDIQLPALQGWHLVMGRNCAVMRVNIMFSSTHVKFTWN